MAEIKSEEQEGVKQSREIKSEEQEGVKQSRFGGQGKGFGFYCKGNGKPGGVFK